MALISPARKEKRASVIAVAARDRGRAESFAKKHGIPRVHQNYDELIADPEINAIYNPLPNSHHAEWTEKALAAGKHVLCEKPFTSNAVEARRVAELAESSGLVVMEAFHYRYHPLARRMVEIVANGTLGRIQHVETKMCVPLPLPGNIRYRLDLAGGALMDTGAYALHMLRHVAGSEPIVEKAEARLASPQVDRWMQAEFRFPEGFTGRATCSLLSSTLLNIGVRVRGELGEMRVFNPVLPKIYHHLKLRVGGETSTERFGREATYYYQLQAFADAVLDGKAILTPPSDSIANMQLIDSVYCKAGLRPRGGVPCD